MYSLGRFLGPSGSEGKTGGTALLRVDVNAEKDTAIGWEEVARTCTGYDDLCVEAAKSRSLSKPKYTYSYSVLVVDATDARNPKVADATLTADVLGTLKWFDTSSLLNQKK